MSLRLFEHNQLAYQAARDLLQEKGKAAVIHPTGTGKSFIAFQLCAENPGKMVWWFSPSEYIFRTQRENLKRSCGVELSNVRFMTYAKLAGMEPGEIAELQAELIILDEFHRCGAVKWEQGVQCLLDSHPGVPVLGLSATNVRYLDNRRDMAQELFQGNIASEITLGEAIARGILKPPKYVMSIYSYKKEIERLELRIQKIRNVALRERARAMLEALGHKLENADGLDAVFRRHIPNPAGKYIVFCTNADHMDEMIAHSREWFSGIDEETRIYRVYSQDPAARQEFQRFQMDRSDHLKLLFTINMLNEGIHVADLDGVILFRPTVSPIVYKQQIGRALSVGAAKTPVIFDVVNNFEGLYSIGLIEQEFEEAVLRYGTEGGESSLSARDRFQIIDEVRDCRMLFEQLNDTLTASWDTMYRYAKEYYEKNGNLNVPCAYKTEGGIPLGAWIMTQRAVRKNPQRGILSEDRIARLNAIGMVWSVLERDRWREFYAAAEEYAMEHGDLLVPAAYVTESGVRLGSWLSTLRGSRKRSRSSCYLAEERVAALNLLGMVWDVDEFQWERKFRAAEAYYQENGHLNIPVRYETPEGIQLGIWVQMMRRDYRSGRLSEEKIRRLEDIHMVWDYGKTQWEKQFQAALEYRERYGHLDIPARYRTEDGMQLGLWLQRMRRDYKKGTLSQTAVSRLESIGITWDPAEHQWEEFYQEARRYYLQYGNLRIASAYETAGGVQLGPWIQRCRKWYKKGSLSMEQIQKLEAIGMVWDAVSEQQNQNYQAAERYFQEHGDLKIPANYVDSSGIHLGWWLKGIRQAYRRGTLDQSKKSALDRIGMVWPSWGDVSLNTGVDT